MKRNLSDYIVAISVIVCSIILLGALTIALSGFRLRKPTRTLQINYEDVTGIKVHSEVRYAGAPAGRVIAVRHLTAAERAASANKKDALLITTSLDEIYTESDSRELMARAGLRLLAYERLNF